MIKTSIFKDIFESESKGTLLTNENGDYFIFSQDYTKYQGLVFNKNMEIYKSIDKIKIKDSKINEVIFNINNIEVNTDKGKQRFYILKEGLIYENYSGLDSEFVFDCRKLFDMSMFGRYYEIIYERDTIIIKFDKKKDISEPNNEEYSFYVAIKTDEKHFENMGDWNESSYEFDSIRKDVSNRFVYSAFLSCAKRAAISFSLDKDEAIDLSNRLYDRTSETKEFNIIDIENKEVKYAYNLSINALSNLIKKDIKGIYAGIPWFMQFWTRDSALSLKSCTKTNKSFVKNTLYDYVKNIRDDGLISNRYPYSGLDSIDSSGLVFFRIKENLDLFNKEELRRIFDSLKKSIDSIFINHFDKFVICKKYETWMDTDVRDGARIEIQALFLSMISLARELSGMFSDPVNAKFYLNKEKELSDNVRKYFFVNGMLYDGPNDSTIRPNVFLAYYFYPRLILDKEWEKVFSKSLDALFLDWGGLSTIDKNDSRFINVHAGMNNISYHNGDSWYFINNLCALCLHRLNKEKYKKYIQKIISASTFEILNLGIFGYHSELSSANNLESNGCLAQAWSSAFYIEAISSIYDLR